MAKEKPGKQPSSQQPSSPKPGGRPAPKPRGGAPEHHFLVYCACGTPLHPDHVEKHRGLMLERYSCPRRRWWNATWHPHTWMEPREGVPS